MFKKVVVGYASDGAGRDAVKLAGAFATAVGASVTIVYPYSPLLSVIPAETAEERVREEVQALLPDSLESASVTYHWSSSSWPIRALHAMASYEDAGLIVVGAAREGLAAHLRVSEMERMVHGAPCAVLVAPAGYADADVGAWRRIGVGFTDSTEARMALRLAREFADTLGSELEVLAAAWVGGAVRGYASMAIPVSTLEDETYAATSAGVERAVAELAADKPVRTRTVRGDPRDELVKQSEALDLLVLGSRGYGPLRHALLGSVSAPVMRAAHCPVLVVPRGSQPEANEAERVRATIGAGAG
ncbi:MAG TPA: universal stress protein [Solirubrobacteraceae bacterium]|nr:universal stress protein [Solirubrobacteraceae bacterium]